MKITAALLLLTFAFFYMPTARAVSLPPLDAIDAGFVTEMGGSAKGDGVGSPVGVGPDFNYSVGYELHYADGAPGPLAPMERDNYFLFDLGAVGPGTITGASLKLYAGTLESPTDLVETFLLVEPDDVGASIADTDMLKAGNASGDPNMFDDGFAPGPPDPLVAVAMSLFGHIEAGEASPIAAPFAITTAMDDTYITIPLSAAGVAYLNSLAGGPVLLGGTVTSIVPATGTPQQPFGFTDFDIPGGAMETPELLLTVVPEPSSFALALAGLTGIGLLRRRR